MISRFLTLIFAAALSLILTACGSAPIESTSPDAIPGKVVTGDSENAAAASTVSYRLSEGDRIGIFVFDEPDLTLQATVSASGVINYSYLGDLQVAGKTAYELEQQIAELLRNGYLVNPSVNVTIVEFRPFFIGGEVRSPGSYPYQPGLTLDKAIALAGGLTDRASTRRMFVVREGRPADKQESIALGAPVGPGDIISIREGFF